MKKALLFDFTVDRENKSIHISREFAAGKNLVWKAWTTAELLDQWLGPQPWRAETKTMDFREGGHWHYAMVGPEGERHWSIMKYLVIVKESHFSAIDSFCDENGSINTEMPQNKWETSFIEKEGSTLVRITLSFDSVADLEKLIEMGFREGITQSLENLDALLPGLE